LYEPAPKAKHAVVLQPLLIVPKGKQKEGLCGATRAISGGRGCAGQSPKVQEGGVVSGLHMCGVWWAGVQWEARRIKKSDHHSKRERGGGREEQKNSKISAQKTKSKKNNFFPTFGSTLPRPPSLPKRPLGLPFGPQTRPDSGYPLDFWPTFN